MGVNEDKGVKGVNGSLRSARSEGSHGVQEVKGVMGVMGAMGVARNHGCSWLKGSPGNWTKKEYVVE